MLTPSFILVKNDLVEKKMSREREAPPFDAGKCAREYVARLFKFRTYATRDMLPQGTSAKSELLADDYLLYLWREQHGDNLLPDAALNDAYFDEVQRYIPHDDPCLEDSRSVSIDNYLTNMQSRVAKFCGLLEVEFLLLTHSISLSPEKKSRELNSPSPCKPSSPFRHRRKQRRRWELR